MRLTRELIQKTLSRLHETSNEVYWSESGVNSRSARVLADSGKEYFVKGYLLPEGDGRDRVDSEFKALEFLWRNGVRAIAPPLLTLPEEKISVFGSVRGRRFRPEFITESDARAAAGFFADLQKLRPKAREAGIGPASEACFSLERHLELVEARLARLEALTEPALLEWIRSGLRPCWKALRADIEAAALEWGLGLGEELTETQKILSPSDVGFHNILRSEDGKLVFIDWEYFGWDDSVKLASDFVLQPSVPMPRNLAEVFVREFSRRMEWTDEDRGRFALCFPIFSFKWCLIVLNVFFPNRQPFLKGDLQVLFSRRIRSSRRLADRLLSDLKSREHERWLV